MNVLWRGSGVVDWLYPVLVKRQIPSPTLSTVCLNLHAHAVVLNRGPSV